MEEYISNNINEVIYMVGCETVETESILKKGGRKQISTLVRRFKEFYKMKNIYFIKWQQKNNGKRCKNI